MSSVPETVTSASPVTADPIISTPIFIPVAGDERVTAFPVARPQMFNMYTIARRGFWTHTDITMAKDVADFLSMNAGKQRLVEYIHAFFAASDGLVNINLAERFCKEVPMQDAKYFYNFQIAMEDIHAHTYSIILEAIIPDRVKRERLINAAQTIPVVAQMSNYMKECISSTAPFAERLLRMACVEGIFFTGCFCAIYWLTDQGLMPSLGHANEMIARDEDMHTQFALYLYTLITPEHKLSRGRIMEIFSEAVDIAAEFIDDAIPRDMVEMTSELMLKYIQCQADNLLTLIDMPALYNTKHSFTFADRINMANRTNFFERRVSEYSQSAESAAGSYAIAEDF